MSLFLTAFGLGIAFCAPPGVLTAQALRRGLLNGFKSAFMVELGSLIGDATWAIIGLVGAAILVQNTIARIVLGGIGVLLLLHLGWVAFKDAYQGKMVEAKPSTMRDDFALGAAISLTNPMAVAYWLSLGGALSSSGNATPTPIDLCIFFTGFMFASVLWCFIFAGLVAWGKRFITPQFFRVINLLCALALLYFAYKLFWDTFLTIQNV